MTVKKIKFFVASNIEKEEDWLTKMSENGLHFIKYQFPFHYFEQDLNHSYHYQIDFRDSDEAYRQLLEDAGWEHKYTFMNKFHYFRADVANSSIKNIYSDYESIKETYQRMMAFYILIFGLMLLSQIGLALTWQGLVLQKIAVSILIVAIALYAYLFISLKNKINYYQKKQKLN